MSGPIPMTMTELRRLARAVHAGSETAPSELSRRQHEVLGSFIRALNEGKPLVSPIPSYQLAMREHIEAHLDHAKAGLLMGGWPDNYSAMAGIHKSMHNQTWPQTVAVADHVHTWQDGTR